MEQAMDVKQAITVNRPPDEAYRFWHDFPNLPRFMEHLESVAVTGERPLALDGRGPGRDEGRVGGRGDGGPARRADRLALG